MSTSFITARTLALAGLISALCVTSGRPALSEENELSFSLATQRNPDAFDKSVATVTSAAFAHTFDSNAIVAASIAYFDVSYSSAWRLNSQIGLGYKYDLSDNVAVIGLASIGSRLQSEDVDFPYYAFNASLDWTLMPTVTWSVVNLRYRDAFKSDYDFETPAIGSSVAFRLDDTYSVSLSYLREWQDGAVSDNEFGIGMSIHF